MKKKIGVVITDGVGYRNFVLGDFMNRANKNFEEVIIFSCLPKSIYKDLPKNIIVEELPVFVESFFTWFFRKFKETAHLKLYKNGNFGIEDCYLSNISTLKTNRGYATRLIYFLTQFLYSEIFIKVLNNLQQFTFKSNVVTKYFVKLLDKYSVDYLFFTHQRPPYIAPLIFASKKLNIISGTFIFSWDNLASKGRMAGEFDTYLVWSELMKDELLAFYTSVTSKQILVVGTPQFEPYVMEKYAMSKEKLYDNLALDINKKMILFTCNDSSSVNDPLYLVMLAKAIKENRLHEKVNLIVRTSPAEDPTRFEEISEEFDFIIWNYPEWKLVRQNHQEAWSQRVPSEDDLKTLRGLLNYCDICINVLSTITIDSFIFDKPVINPVFGNTKNEFWDDQKFLKYKHLQVLENSEATHIVKNEREYIDSINRFLKEEDDKVLERRKFVELQISKPLEGTSDRITNAIIKFCK